MHHLFLFLLRLWQVNSHFAATELSLNNLSSSFKVIELACSRAKIRALVCLFNSKAPSVTFGCLLYSKYPPSSDKPSAPFSE